MTSKPLMFCTPNRGIEYPYVLYNMWYLINRPNEVKRIIDHKPKHVILDVGVNALFEVEKKKEYPKWFLNKYFMFADKFAGRIKALLPNCKVWVVIPDYPADIQDNPLENNVERTIQNWLRFKDKQSKWFEWLPVIQAKTLDMESFVYCINEYKRIWKGYDKAGIGTVCKWRDVNVIKNYVRTARRHLPNIWLHAFGPTKPSLPHIWRYINSFDSITNVFHVYGSKGGLDVWNRYLQKWSFLDNLGLIKRWLP